MNLSDEELEQELAALKPTAPSPALEAKLREALDSEAESPGTLIRFWPLIAVAAAACLALVLVMNRPSSDATSGLANDTVAQVEAAETLSDDPFANFQAVDAEQRLVEAIDDGVVLVVDNEPVRRLRYQFIDSVTLVNEADGSVFTMEVPREETLFVPVSLL